MSLLADLNRIAKDTGIAVETGVFSEPAPAVYLVMTPLADTFEIHADNVPELDVQEVRISLFTTGSYTKWKNTLVRAILAAGITITERRYIGHDDDSGYHNYAIDVAHYYEMEE
jgi:hypothetical protein